MSTKRKNVSVATIRDRVNLMIAAPKSTEDGRKALGVLLSCLLLETGNYHGFNYLAWTKEGGWEKWCEESRRTNNMELPTTPYLGDESRVEYS